MTLIVKLRIWTKFKIMQRSNTNRQHKSLESSNFLPTRSSSRIWGRRKKNRKRCCATENVFFPLVKSPRHEDKDADVDNTRLRARQQMWCNYGMMYQALKLPHHLHDYRSDRVRKRALTKKYPRLSSGEKKKKGERRRRRGGEKGALNTSAGGTWFLVPSLKSMNSMDLTIKGLLFNDFIYEDRFWKT